MKLFQDSRGFVFSFGFDMVSRKPNSGIICWCDPATQEWDINSNNLAGSLHLPFLVAPEFIRQISDLIIAYQSGRCIELRYIGAPLVFSMNILTSDAQDHAALAA